MKFRRSEAPEAAEIVAAFQQAFGKIEGIYLREADVEIGTPSSGDYVIPHISEYLPKIKRSK